MRIGFIGSGAITKAVVAGLCNSSLDVASIMLSPRNAEVAASLAELDSRVSVCKDNQHVLDTSDVVCVAVLPSAAQAVLRELKFHRSHLVVSFVAGLALNELKNLVGTEPEVVRAIPLPATAQGNGSTVVYPANGTAAQIFAAIGASVEVTGENHFDAFSAVTATMSTYYSFVEAQAQWLVGRGIPYEKARAFLAGYYVGLARLAEGSDQSFSEMAEECTTKGGINEQMYRQLLSEGVFRQFGAALDNVWRRLI